MSDFILKAEKRDVLGKGASRRLRRENKMPAIIYGGDKEPVSITISHFEILKNLNSDAFYSQIIDIDLDGEKIETVLRDLQRHPYKPAVLHADFLRVVRGQEITVHVPIHLMNADKSKAIKAGGVLSHNIIDIEISCRPSLLPKSIDVDVSALEIGDVIKLSEIKLPEGVSIPALVNEENDVPVVVIHAPKASSETVEEGEGEESSEEDAS